MQLGKRISRAWSALVGKPVAQRENLSGFYGMGPRGGYAGGSVGRLTASLATWSGSANSDLDGPLPVLRARARALAGNNEHGKRFLSLVARNVIGRANPQLQVRAYFQAGPKQEPTLDKAANDAIEIHYQRWGKTADITGNHKSLPAFWRMVVKGVARDGEALVRLVRDKSLPYGIALQALDVDRLDETINAVRLQNGNSIRHGVEIDSAGRAVAYHIRTVHPGENYATGAPGVERVPATDMIHLFLQERAEQVRGVTWFHAVIIRGSTIHRFEDAAVVAAEIGASKIATLEASAEAITGGEVGAGIGDRTSDGTAAGIPQISTEPGELIDLTNYPGVSMNSWNPDYPHQNFESFLKACLRGLAAGLDVAAHNLTGDMGDVNYSSARIAELSERETWMCLQDWIIGNLVERVYSEWLAIAMLRGDIRFESSGKALPVERLDKFLVASSFMGRRWKWVDPAKEMDAHERGVALGVTSRTRIAAEEGIDIEDVIDELERERAMMDDAGIPVDPKAPAAAAPPPPAAPKSDPALAKAIEALGRAASREPVQAPAPSVTVHPTMTIHQAPVTIDNHMPEQAAPQVTIENRMPEQPAPNVEVTVEAVMPEQPAPVVEVKVETPDTIRIAEMPARVTTSEVERNMAGEIVRTTQTEADA